MSERGPKAAKKPRERPDKKRVPPPSQPAPPLFDDLLDNYAGVEPLSDWEAQPTIVAGTPVSPAPATERHSAAVRKVSVTPTAEAHKASSLDEQMFVLLGGQEFRQREPSRPPATRLASIKQRGRLSRLIWVTTLIAVAVFSAVVVSFGLERRAEDKAKELASQLRTASDTGQLIDAEDLVRAIGDSDVSTPEQAELVATTEAVLFRERDAEPKRLERIQALQPKISKDVALVVKATLLSNVERLPLLDDLKRIAADSPDSLPAYLLAVTLARAGSNTEASKQFEVALDREPSNLEHLAAFARHCIKTGALNEAENALGIMREVNPGATRTRWLALRLNRAQQTDRHPVLEADETETGGVGESQLELTYALQLHADNKSGADEHLAQALKLVNNHPSFVLDVVDELLAAAWFDGAEAALKRIEVGASPSPVEAAQARIDLGRGGTDQALAALSQLFEAGYREPRLGAAYLKALAQAGAPKAQQQEVFRTLQTTWPDAEWAAEVAPKKAKKKRRRKRRSRRRTRR